jgi:hypothetical protein
MARRKLVERLEWKDTTSYSRDDKERIPRTWKLEKEYYKLSICVTRIVHYEGWYMNCYNLGMIEVSLKTGNLEEAKKEALRLVADRIDELSKQYRELVKRG